MSQVKHSLNTCYVVFDLFLGGVPIRVLHMFFPIMLGSVYSTFNAIYFLNDGTVIDGRRYAYSVLDWQSPASAIVTCMLAMIQTILSQCILYELYRLRMWIFSKLYFTRDEPATASEMQSIISNEPIKYATIDEEPKGVEEPSP